jgi:hypothetical protein
MMTRTITLSTYPLTITVEKVATTTNGLRVAVARVGEVRMWLYSDGRAWVNWGIAGEEITTWKPAQAEVAAA